TNNVRDGVRVTGERPNAGRPLRDDRPYQRLRHRLRDVPLAAGRLLLILPKGDRGHRTAKKCAPFHADAPHRRISRSVTGYGRVPPQHRGDLAPAVNHAQLDLTAHREASSLAARNARALDMTAGVVHGRALGAPGRGGPGPVVRGRTRRSHESFSS